MAKIKIISKDFQGPVRNGGVGTAFYEYALTLSKQHEVECLLTCPESFIEGQDFDFWKKRYKVGSNLDLRLLDAEISEELIEGIELFSPELKRAYRAFLYVKNTDPDIVIFGDYGADGFFMVQDHNRQYKTVCVVHGTSFWGKFENSESLLDPMDYLQLDLELTCISNADHTIFPSKYIHEWHMRFLGREPKNAHYICNPYQASSIDSTTYKDIKSLIYFGRIEHRKGIDIYLEALMKLQNNKKIEKHVIGKLGAYDSGSVLNMLSSKLAKLDGAVQVVTSLNSRECIEYIKEKSGLVIFPSRADNCPLTVLECVKNNIPILISSKGGQVELIDEKSYGSSIFEPSAGSLAKLIDKTLEIGGVVPKLSKFALEADLDLLKFINSIGSNKPNLTVKQLNSNITVTVCIPTLNKDVKRLKKLLEKIIKWDVKISIINDGGASFTDEQISFFKENKIHYQSIENSYPGKARNILATVAETAYLLFLDDDNVPHDYMYEQYLNEVKRNGSLLVSSWFYCENQSQNIRYIQSMLGISGHSDYFDNKISDNNILINKELFNKVGGYPVQWGVGYEDFAMLRNCLKKTDKVSIIPRPLFTYQISDTGVNNSSNITAGFYSLVLNDSNSKVDASNIYLASMRAKQLLSRRSNHIASIFPSLEVAAASPEFNKINPWDILFSFVADKKSNMPFLDEILCKWIINNANNAEQMVNQLNLYNLLHKIYGELGELNSNQVIMYAYLWLYIKHGAPEILEGDFDRIKDISKNGLHGLAKIINLLKLDAYLDANRNLNLLIKSSELKYLVDYPDIAEGVKSGIFKNGLSHYLQVAKTEPWRKYGFAGLIFLAKNIIGSNYQKFN